MRTKFYGQSETYSRARSHSTTGRASLITCEILYKEDPEGWQQAKGLLSQLIGTDRAKCQTALNKRAEYQSLHPVTDETISNVISNGPRASAPRNSQRNRSRSRSPASSRNTASNPGTNSSRRPLANRPQNTTAATTQSNTKPDIPRQSRGRGRGRTNNRSRSSSRSRDGILLFSRDNNNSRQRSPRNSPNTRSFNSLWNENDRYQNRRASQRRNLNLTEAETALVNAFRSRNNE